MRTTPEDHGMDGERLARFIAGECTDDERAEILGWMRADPARGELVASLDAVWRLTEAGAATWDVDRAWNEVAAEAAHRADRDGSREVRAPSRPRRAAAMWALRGAAALVIVLGGALLWDQIGRPVPDAVSRAPREIATGPAERTAIDLTDGTRVVLAPDSRLRISGGYGGDARELQLEGQAVFEVASDPTRPFRVHTRAVVTEVIGTRFAVRAYDGDPDVAVALAEGAVRVRATDAQDDAPVLTLRPGQVARAAATGGPPRLDRDARAVSFLAWADGRLVFEDTPLDEAARELGRWYDVQISLADESLSTRRLTASFRDEPVSQVLDLIALSLDLRYQRDGRVIVLSGQ